MGTTESSLQSLLDEREVARITSISLASIRRRRLLKQSPRYIKIGASVRYRPEDLKTWLDSLAGSGEAA